jgi:hypothetical protein
VKGLHCTHAARPYRNLVEINSFLREDQIYYSILQEVQSIIIKITSRTLNHLTTTTIAEVSRRRAVVAAPILEPAKHC